MVASATFLINDTGAIPVQRDIGLQDDAIQVQIRLQSEFDRDVEFRTIAGIDTRRRGTVDAAWTIAAADLRIDERSTVPLVGEPSAPCRRVEGRRVANAGRRAKQRADAVGRALAVGNRGESRLRQRRRPGRGDHGIDALRRIDVGEQRRKRRDGVRCRYRPQIGDLRGIDGIVRVAQAAIEFQPLDQAAEIIFERSIDSAGLGRRILHAVTFQNGRKQRIILELPSGSLPVEIPAERPAELVLQRLSGHPKLVADLLLRIEGQTAASPARRVTCQERRAIRPEEVRCLIIDDIHIPEDIADLDIRADIERTGVYQIQVLAFVETGAGVRNLAWAERLLEGQTTLHRRDVIRPGIWGQAGLERNDISVRVYTVNTRERRRETVDGREQGRSIDP